MQVTGKITVDILTRASAHSLIETAGGYVTEMIGCNVHEAELRFTDLEQQLLSRLDESLQLLQELMRIPELETLQSHHVVGYRVIATLLRVCPELRTAAGLRMLRHHIKLDCADHNLVIQLWWPRISDLRLQAPRSG